MMRLLSRRIPPGLPARSRQRGQAMAEYFLATLAIITALIVPVPGWGQSVIGWMIGVLHTWWMNFSFLLSLP